MRKILFNFFVCCLFTVGYAVEEDVAYCDLCPVDSCPYTGFFCSDPCDWAIEVYGELLYWNAKEDGLDFSQYETFGLQPPTAPSSKANYVNTDNFDLGYRVGLKTFKLCECHWDLGGTYTYFSSSSKGDAPVDLSTTEQFAPYLNYADITDFLSSNGANSNAQWKLRYNTADVEVGYSVDAPCCLQFRPHIGVRGAWINQHLNVNYNNLTVAGSTPLVNISVHNKTNFKGVGLRLGGDVNWNLWKRVALFGKGSTSLIWGQFNVNQKSFYPNTTTFGGTTSPPGTIRNEDPRIFYTIVPALDLTTGISWTVYTGWRCFNYCLFSLGWEYQLWFGQHRWHRFLNDSNNFGTVPQWGNLSMQGLVFRVGACF